MTTRLMALGLAAALALPAIGLAQPAPARRCPAGSRAARTAWPPPPRPQCAEADRDPGRPGAGRQADPARRLQGRALCLRHARRPHDGGRGQRHAVHRHARPSAGSMRWKDGKTYTIASGLTQPNGVAFKDGALYVVAINKVLRFDGIEGKLDAPGTPTDLTAAFGLPTEEHHGWKFIDLRAGREALYAGRRALQHLRADENQHAVLLRYQPGRLGPRGRRPRRPQQRRHGCHPVTGQLWFTNNGRDWARRGRAAGRASAGDASWASISASPTATWAPCRTPR